MKKLLKINAGGVPEHFNMPWYLAQDQDTLTAEGIELNWRECRGGTGEMTTALRNGELDVAVLLTEGIVADIIHGNPSKIVQFYVNSPLRWGIHVPANSDIYTLDDLAGKKYAISRPKSGSHLMAYVHADQLQHPISEEDFVVVKNLDGGRAALSEGKADVFLWELFTTQPYVDNGEFRRIGECPTPWPCFVVAVRNEFLEEHPLKIKQLLTTINSIAASLSIDTNTADRIAEKFSLQVSEVKKWLAQLEWNSEVKENEEALIDVIHKLTMLGIIDIEDHPVNLSDIWSSLMQPEPIDDCCD